MYPKNGDCRDSLRKMCISLFPLGTPKGISKLKRKALRMFMKKQKIYEMHG